MGRLLSCFSSRIVPLMSLERETPGYGKSCKSCKQKYLQDLESALLPEKEEYVTWSRLKKDKNGVRCIPDGEECGNCKLTRMSSFGGMELCQLMDIRSKEPQMNHQFITLRTQNARGENLCPVTGKRKHEKIKSELLVDKKKKVYSDVFTDHEFYTLEEFCSKHHRLDRCDTVAKQKDFVEVCVDSGKTLQIQQRANPPQQICAVGLVLM